MSYTPPSSGAVNFSGTGAAYTPPAHAAVDFCTTPSVPTAEGFCSTFFGTASIPLRASGFSSVTFGLAVSSAGQAAVAAGFSSSLFGVGSAHFRTSATALNTTVFGEGIRATSVAYPQGFKTSGVGAPTHARRLAVLGSPQEPYFGDPVAVSVFSATPISGAIFGDALARFVAHQDGYAMTAFGGAIARFKLGAHSIPPAGGIGIGWSQRIQPAHGAAQTKFGSPIGTKEDMYKSRYRHRLHILHKPARMEVRT